MSSPTRIDKEPAAPNETEERIKRFLATASHDLQSPLRHITMYAEILLDDLEETLDTEQLQSLRMILEKAQTAQRLTKALMTFAAGTPQVAMGETSLNAILENVWAELKQEMDITDATIAIADLPSVRTDAGLLGTALKNVISNALLCRSAAPHVTIHAERHGSNWAIHIADNGPGIDPAHHDKIFDPFWRLPKTGTVPGPGLGLTTARDLLKALGGDILLDHSDENGSRFTVTLPVK
jgi:light-regulated signal transduction histidine kinase (bacteriophytochrome)